MRPCLASGSHSELVPGGQQSERSPRQPLYSAHQLRLRRLQHLCELREVQPLAVGRVVGAGQHGHEMLCCACRIARLARLPPQHVMKVLLYQRPLPAPVHAQHQPAQVGWRMVQQRARLAIRGSKVGWPRRQRQKAACSHDVLVRGCLHGACEKVRFMRSPDADCNCSATPLTFTPVCNHATPTRCRHPTRAAHLYARCARLRWPHMS